MRQLLLSLMILCSLNVSGQAAELTPLEQLGKFIFYDTSLSSPAGQSCASCHDPAAGFSGPTSSVNATTAVYPGAAPGRAGNRKPPSVAYASFSPSFTYNKDDETYVGGQFWDGRALNLTDQAKAPFLNPLEMNNASAAEVVGKIQQSAYRQLFVDVYGEAARTEDADQLFDLVAQALAAYESSREVNPFSSKYDAYLAEKVKLTPQEQRGLELFANKANCTACHPHEAGNDGTPPLFTDFTYDNVGAPRNAGNPYYRMPADINPDADRYRDLGLGGSLKQQDQWGKVKVPTLRNVGRKPSPGFVKSYLHNGTFKSLQEVVHFYNARDAAPEEFGAPDVAENVNRDELGNLQLTHAEEEDLVAFLETLSDGYLLPGSENSTAEPPGPVVENHGLPDESTVPLTVDRFRGAADIARVLRFRSPRPNVVGGDERLKR